MVVEHRAIQNPRRTGPDLLEAASAVSEKVMLAAYDASRELTWRGIPHALIGGLAVGAHGAPRATKDVDFLVSQADAFEGTVVLSFKPGVPIAVRGIVVDYLTPEGSPHAALLSHALKQAKVSQGVPVIALAPLVLMKLQAARRRDLDDVSRLLQRADDEERIREYLKTHAPELVEQLDLALEE
jgi:hypothetical protein